MAMGNAKDEFDDALLIDDAEDEIDEDEEEEEDVDDEKSEDAEQEEDDSDSEDEEDSSAQGDDGDDEDSSDEEEVDSSKDRKEQKIVALKREIREAKKRMRELEERIQSESLDEQFSGKRREMLDDGYSERDVEEIINILKENAILKQKQEAFEWNELAKKYPKITSFRQQITEVKKTLPEASIEDIYLAKFSKSSAYDEKIRIEQELKYKQTKSQQKSKGSVSGKATKAEATKLSPSNERAYKEAIKFNPSMTRKDFLKALEEEELT